jgi:hypothetical protein
LDLFFSFGCSLGTLRPEHSAKWNRALPAAWRHFVELMKALPAEMAAPIRRQALAFLDAHLPAPALSKRCAAFYRDTYFGSKSSIHGWSARP